MKQFFKAWGWSYAASVPWIYYRLNGYTNPSGDYLTPFNLLWISFESSIGIMAILLTIVGIVKSK